MNIDDHPVALVDYLPNNPKDGHPWLGFLMIRGDVHGKGIGRDVYQAFEKRLVEGGIETLRLAVLETNDRGKVFWKSHGFTFYRMNHVDDNPVECYEKEL
ncbi:GNAT family N-acetyltransferase [Halobacillus locisalis]|uniref:GNAT family N-acetyltransferase n=1 Tax=Halobacillus locisalis TaxID=220753 RepID=A0A838CWP8_9BACI|nr:GNAT family N-acetyltransferase [Halobacillus locisalis]